MAEPKIKATYALDTESVRALERMARRLRISKSEALRRAIHAVAESASYEPRDALAALDRLQGAAELSADSARRWSSALRSERKAAASRRESRRK